jgi:hypothetical protein
MRRIKREAHELNQLGLKRLEVDNEPPELSVDRVLIRRLCWAVFNDAPESCITAR